MYVCMRLATAGNWLSYNVYSKSCFGIHGRSDRAQWKTALCHWIHRGLLIVRQINLINCSARKLQIHGLFLCLANRYAHVAYIKVDCLNGDISFVAIASIDMMLSSTLVDSLYGLQSPKEARIMYFVATYQSATVAHSIVPGGRLRTAALKGNRLLE